MNPTTRRKIRDTILEHLKGKAVKLALKKLLGSAAAGGFKAWLIKLIVSELYDEVGEPVIEFGLRKVGVVYRKIDGKIKVTRLDRARENQDADAYDATIRDILS